MTTMTSFFLLWCLDCEVDDPIPFDSAYDRAAWAAVHALATGHDRCRVFDSDSVAQGNDDPVTYDCGVCNGTFEYDPDWTDEDAQAEASDLFSPEELEDPVIVCDDCYHRIGLG